LDAEFSCRAHNARLAEVQSKEQSTFLVNMCKTKGPVIKQSCLYQIYDNIIKKVFIQKDNHFDQCCSP
ncbi:hypothetical protein AM593_07223, partial [Mytilus galloprovincialis]